MKPRKQKLCKHEHRAHYGSFCLDCDMHFNPHWYPGVQDCPTQMVKKDLLEAAETALAEAQKELAEVRGTISTLTAAAYLSGLRSGLGL